MSKHTPWVAWGDPNPTVFNSEGKSVAICRHESHAHLIAAAPDMYEALEELMYARTDKAERMAEAALAKAKGEA